MTEAWKTYRKTATVLARQYREGDLLADIETLEGPSTPQVGDWHVVANTAMREEWPIPDEAFMATYEATGAIDFDPGATFGWLEFRKTALVQARQLTSEQELQAVDIRRLRTAVTPNLGDWLARNLTGDEHSRAKPWLVRAGVFEDTHELAEVPA